MSGTPNLAYGSWEDAEAMVGQVVARLEGADPVSAADIRRKLEVTGFDCPLHYDEDCAREHGYRTIVSPVSMYRTWVTAPYWRPGEEPLGTEPVLPPVAITSVPAPGSEMFATKVRSEYVAPVYPGDRISGTAVLQSVTRKRTRMGDGAFLVTVTTWHNQDGEVVGRDHLTVFRFDRDEEDVGS